MSETQAALAVKADPVAPAPNPDPVEAAGHKPDTKFYVTMAAAVVGVGLAMAGGVYSILPSETKERTPASASRRASDPTPARANVASAEDGTSPPKVHQPQPAEMGAVAPTPAAVQSDTFAEISARVERAMAAGPAPVARSAALPDERLQRLEAAMRERDQWMEEAMRGRDVLFKKYMDFSERRYGELEQHVRLVEAENSAGMASIHYRLGTARRGALVAAPVPAPSPAVDDAAPLPAEVASAVTPAPPVQPAPVAAAAAAPRPVQTPTPAPVRAAAPARPAGDAATTGLYQIANAWPDAALLSVRRPGPGQATHVLAQVGADLPGMGKVERIVRRGNLWEVHAERGVVTQ